MLNLLRNVWRRWIKLQPKVWALRDPTTGVWTKVVAFKEPFTQIHFEWMRVGPFRSELDCEEYCDRTNKALVQRTVSLYNPTYKS